MSITTRQYVGRVEFLANLDRIKALHAAGHSQRAIYEHHLDLTMSYSQFNRYVVKYVTRREGVGPRQRPAAAGACESGQQHEGRKDIPQAAITSPATMKDKPVPMRRGFYFDPMDAYTRDDLI